MAIRLTAGDTLLVNDQPMKLEDLKQETVRLVHRLGKKHLISIESDRDANYNLYFQMQNELMEAYANFAMRQPRRNIIEICSFEQ